jgi:hypothetical protein
LSCAVPRKNGKTVSSSCRCEEKGTPDSMTPTRRCFGASSCRGARGSGVLRLRPGQPPAHPESPAPGLSAAGSALFQKQSTPYKKGASPAPGAASVAPWPGYRRVRFAPGRVGVSHSRLQ